MDTADLKENLRQVISLRDEIVQLRKEDRRTYSLREYVDLFQDRLRWTDHGESDRFWRPMHVAITKLDEISNIDVKKFNSAFTTHKAKLLSIVNRYIKDLQLGFEQQDLELMSIRRD
jgi:hypothetical protein